MANLRIGYVNRWKSGTITASSAAAGLPAAATQHPDRKYVWRSNASAGVATLDIDLGSSMAVTLAAAANVKLVGTGVLRVNSRGSGGAPGASTLQGTLPTQNSETLAAAVAFGSVSARHWQFEWTNPSVVSDYAELGFAFLGTYLEPSLNVLPGWPLRRDDPSVSRASLGRQKQFATREKYFAGQWSWDAAGFTDFDNLRAVYDTVGVSGEVVFVLDSTFGWTTWFARLSGALAMSPSLAQRRAGVQLPWEELR